MGLSVFFVMMDAFLELLLSVETCSCHVSVDPILVRV